MMIVGVDYHPSFQAIAFLIEETGECAEQKLRRSPRPSASTADVYAGWDQFDDGLRYVDTSDIQASQAAGATIRTGNAGSYRLCRVPVPLWYTTGNSPQYRTRNSHRLTPIVEESHEENSASYMGPACPGMPFYTGCIRSALREGALVGENWN